MSGPTLQSRSRSITSILAQGCGQIDGSTSFTPSIYDTAWLAMIPADKKPGVAQTWLFPGCFDYLLLQQSLEGAWPVYASQIDGILNSLAALLALSIHRDAAKTPPVVVARLSERIIRAREATGALLTQWQVLETVHVGFEILVPSLLDALEARDVTFEFPGRKSLLGLYEAKLAKFQPQMLYTSHATTLLHSLEAFVGKLDFDKLEHHLSPSGMLGSPSSTAAYLMSKSTWDDRAEQYLQNVVGRHGGNGASGVPSASPTHIFEASWVCQCLSRSQTGIANIWKVLSTLLYSGFEASQLGTVNVDAISDHLAETLEAQEGVTGFAPGMLPDADDSARSIATLQLLGRPASVAFLIDMFEDKSNFKTYQLDGKPSFSANCNVLLALLSAESQLNVRSIEKATRWLCSYTDQNNNITDKWNLSEAYSLMLLSLCLVNLLRQHDAERLTGFEDHLITYEVPLVLSDIIAKVSVQQACNGSWNGVEETAYAVLALSYALQMPWPSFVRQAAEKQVHLGKTFLKSQESRWAHPNYLWIEKVTYGSAVLSETFCICAVKVEATEQIWQTRVRSIFHCQSEGTAKVTTFMSRLPVLSGISNTGLHTAVFSANICGRRLQTQRDMVFPQTDGLDKDKGKYMQYIPLTWTLCNNLSGQSRLPRSVLWDMMVVSMLQYQADEFMESNIPSMSAAGIEALETIIQNQCDSSTLSVLEASAKRPFAFSSRPGSVKPQAGYGLRSTNSDRDPAPPRLSDLESTLHAYVQHFLNHPRALAAPPGIRAKLSSELGQFLLGHISHFRDSSNLLLQQQQSEPLNQSFGEPKLSIAYQSTPSLQTYLRWVRGAAADDTSCVASFVFFRCLISPDDQHCVHGSRQNYLVDALAQHLATMCRQYNDYGSVSRDFSEGTLNSLHFADFALTSMGHSEYQKEVG